MAKMGRPVKEIRWEDFEKLCAIHCTLEEIASFFDVSADTIERRVKEEYKCTFAEAKAQKAGKGKLSLRRKMYEMAMGGDRVMLIWLSKQYLGMTDKIDKAIDHNVNGVSKAELIISLPDNGRSPPTSN